MYPRCHQLVRIKDSDSPSLGRYGYIVAVDELNFQVKVEFVDEPELVSRNPRTQWCFGWADIEVIEGVPVARLYILVSVLTRVGKQEQVRYVLAHVEDDQQTYDVAETVAARFFGGLGDYNGVFYQWPTSQSAKLIDFDLTTIGHYHFLSRILPDYDLGADIKGIPF